MARWSQSPWAIQIGPKWCERSNVVRDGRSGSRRIEAEQVPLQSFDLTAVVVRLPDRSILVVSVYIEVQDEEALLDTTAKVHQLIQETRNRIGIRGDEILAGDFNRHGQLWE
jgi:hypothetical protein